MTWAGCLLLVFVVRAACNRRTGQTAGVDLRPLTDTFPSESNLSVGEYSAADGAAHYVGPVRMIGSGSPNHQTVVLSWRTGPHSAASLHSLG